MYYARNLIAHKKKKILPHQSTGQIRTALYLCSMVLTVACCKEMVVNELFMLETNYAWQKQIGFN